MRAFICQLEEFLTLCELYGLCPTTEKAAVVWVVHCMDNLRLKQKTLQAKVCVKWSHMAAWNLGNLQGSCYCCWKGCSKTGKG